MVQQLIYILASFKDLGLAIFDILTFRKRRRYTHSIFIAAPREIVWDTSGAVEISHNSTGFHSVEEPVDGFDDVVRYRISIKGKPKALIAARILERTAGQSCTCMYVPELSEYSAQIGTDDIVTCRLSDAPGGTRYELSRELTHKRPGTRISVPLGLRMAGWMSKVESESRTGTGPTPQSKIFNQLALTAVTFASFWLMMGFEDAAIVLVLVILHELGHAAAMLMIGIPVGFVSLIPFLGGVAAPKRPYDNDWQHGFVALMGPGFSVIPAAALLWWGYASQNEASAHAAALFAFINGANLAPISPLDGGVIVRCLLGSASQRLGTAIAWTGTAAGFGLSVYLASPLLAFVFVFSALQLATQKSLDMDQLRQHMTLGQAAGLFIAFAAVAAAYVILAASAVTLEVKLGDQANVEEPASEGIRPPGP